MPYNPISTADCWNCKGNRTIRFLWWKLACPSCGGNRVAPPRPLPPTVLPPSRPPSDAAGQLDWYARFGGPMNGPAQDVERCPKCAAAVACKRPTGTLPPPPAVVGYHMRPDGSECLVTNCRRCGYRIELPCAVAPVPAPVKPPPPAPAPPRR